MTFVVSAFQMYVLHFGHFFENRKNSGLTPGQNDDPVTQWPSSMSAEILKEIPVPTPCTVIRFCDSDRQVP